MVNDLNELFKGKTVAITGGLGSIGSHIILNLLKYDVKKIILLDNRETGLFYSSEYPKDKRIESFFCDVREKEVVERLLKNVDIVFHAAALKHVVVGEKNPFETIKTNVIGTQNVIESCLKNNVKKMILISTDKAVNPTNVMGATKLLAERLVSAMIDVKQKNTTRFGILRFGNVLYSRGSVLEIWERQLKKGEPITITDPDMTRFFMDVSQSVDLIFNATFFVKNSETFILKMPSVKIDVLAKAFLQIKGYNEENVRIIGARPGEKSHEELLLSAEEGLIIENDKFFVKLPVRISEDEIEKYKDIGFIIVKNKRFISDYKPNLLDIGEVKKILISSEIIS
jgi:UDP-N-acetylglucosamine 4,6-dehydratase/5-epimerase